MRRARVDLRLPDAQKDRWVEFADAHGLDLSELIRRGTDHYVGFWKAYGKEPDHAPDCGRRDEHEAPRECARD